MFFQTDYSKLFTTIEGMAPSKLKEFLIYQVLSEANRFKRKELATLIEKKFLNNNHKETLKP